MSSQDTKRSVKEWQSDALKDGMDRVERVRASVSLVENERLATDANRCAAQARESETREFNSAEIGAMAHLYRSEVNRCSIWRTRLDTTTNWAVVTLGVALSISYASPEASPLPLLLVGILNLFFLKLEARRYRYCDSWRNRFRTLERNFYGPILGDGRIRAQAGWNLRLQSEYLYPAFQISYLRAMGRRVRRGYLWIMLIQTLAYMGKITVHPSQVTSYDELLQRATIGPIPGLFVLVGGGIYMAMYLALAEWSRRADARDQAEQCLPEPDAIY